ncbi:hypothetical protein WA026_004640 [Henosepilachna vigintioctopunctata]|uniref:SH3 domain-containing protein n=1 Tax=Henosepilachna vigintioctopunctata TaxID=420089 RepID=A0AAW1V760_9CUCU
MPFKVTSSQQSKKKPPPRPPPPNLNKLKSKSTHNIHKNFDCFNLIDWGPPNSPRSESMPKFGGSVSSSFSSSTSSLASIKKTTDYEGLLPTSFSTSVWGSNTLQNTNNSGVVNSASQNNNFISNIGRINGSTTTSASLFGPTIIRPQSKKKFRPDIPGTSQNTPTFPMPTGPPPSPPKEVADVITPYGIALYEFPATQAGDLGLEVDDVVILIRRVNKEWLYGQVEDREGIFPENFINVINPLPEDLR